MKLKLATKNAPAPAAATQSRARRADHPNRRADTTNSHHPNLTKNTFDIDLGVLRGAGRGFMVGESATVPKVER
jgi:hypothetical protein